MHTIRFSYVFCMTPHIKSVLSALLITFCWTSGRFAHAIEEWEQVAVGQFDAGINAIAYGGGQFVAVGSGSFVATSPDGVVVASGSFVATSPDGVIWTPKGPKISAFAGVRDYTPEGPIWDDLKKDYYPHFTDITFGDGLFMVVAGNDAPIFSTPDGITWYAENSVFESSYRGVDFGNTLFVATQVSGEFWTSVGSKSYGWEKGFVTTPESMNSTTFGRELFVSVGDGGAIFTAIEPEHYFSDYLWIRRESDTSNDLLSVAYGNGVFVATSRQGTVLTSSNGFDWEEQILSPSEGALNGVTWGAGYFVVVGAATNTGNGANLWTSTDGINWTRRNAEVNESLKDVTFDGARFVAVGEKGTIIRSSAVEPGESTRIINLSNRAYVGEGDNVLLGSMVIADAPLRIYARVAGPSLAASITNPLSDPELELIQILPTGNIQIGTNFDWRTEQEALIQSTGIPPSDDLEPAIVKTLQPGTYSIVVRGVGGTTGVANVEIYEFKDPAETVHGRLTNLSNRAFVGAGETVLIGSFIIQGNVPRRIYARVIGPSLPSIIMNPLLDSELELVQISPNGSRTIAINDNWGYQSRTILSTGIYPESGYEPAIAKTLEPGIYSIVVKGVGGTEGVANVEIYDYPEP